jgi:hypothetical protein
LLPVRSKSSRPANLGQAVLFAERSGTKLCGFHATPIDFAFWLRLDAPLGCGDILNDPQSAFGFPRLSAFHLEKIKTDSAVNPLLWLAAFSLPPTCIKK